MELERGFKIFGWEELKRYVGCHKGGLSWQLLSCARKLNVRQIHNFHSHYEVCSHMHIEFRHLRTIQAIHEEGGLARAADRLNITQSALSHQIKGIEDQAGVELFVRRSKPMKLSAAGFRLLRVAEKVLPEIAALEAEFMGLRQGSAGSPGLQSCPRRDCDHRRSLDSQEGCRTDRKCRALAPDRARQRG